MCLFMSLSTFSFAYSELIRLKTGEWLTSLLYLQKLWGFFYVLCVIVHLNFENCRMNFVVFEEYEHKVQVCKLHHLSAN